MKRTRQSIVLAPAEEEKAPRFDERRATADPAPSQRAWGAVGAAAGSALLATIVGPMVAAVGENEMNFDIPAADSDTADIAVGPNQDVVYLEPGQTAPSGAPVVRLDPVTVAASPRPGSVAVAPAPKRKVIYLYLQPGETPPPGAIVQQAGSVAVTPSTVVPTPNAGGGSATPRPIVNPPIVNPPVVKPPVVNPPVVNPPVTRPSG